MKIEMKPFNLERAKAGDPIVCRNGTPAKFIAHVPETSECSRVIGLSDGLVFFYYENGFYAKDEPYVRDLFMAKKKRTVWINLYANEIYENEDQARMFSRGGRINNKAYPVEIEE